MNKIFITQDNIDEIIAREIESTASEQEIIALKEWIAAAEMNRSYYNQIHEVDSLFKNKKNAVVDTDKAWSKLKSQINTEEQSNVKTIFSKRPMFNYLSYAAAIALLIISGIFLYRKQTASPQQYAATIEAVSHELTDGTKVNLEKNSALSLLKGSNRQYTFTGKGEFTVKHDDKQPFILHINQIKIEDLGTVFTVDAKPASDTIQVSVTEGKVQFFSQEDKGIALQEGEEAIYIKSKNKFFKRTIDKTKSFLNASFQNAVLSDVLDQLSYSFRKNVKFENDVIKKCNITVDFTEANYALVKEIIEETLNVKLQENSSEIVVNGNGCN
jgi:transmembrane sensor